MTLSEFFAALQNPQMVVTIKAPGTGGAAEELTKIYASGYEQLLAALLARTVDKITVENNKAITVHLAASL